MQKSHNLETVAAGIHNIEIMLLFYAIHLLNVCKSYSCLLLTLLWLTKEIKKRKGKEKFVIKETIDLLPFCTVQN